MAKLTLDVAKKIAYSRGGECISKDISIIRCQYFKNILKIIYDLQDLLV
jgi:hypothetical protein